MSEQELEGVFENFYRTEHVRKAAIPGTGLGLAISRGLVRGHGGDITVSSRQGEVHHPEDRARPPPEDQGENSSEAASNGEDLVDEETKQLSSEEAEQHDGIIDAQKDQIDAEGDSAEEGAPGQGGYGH